MPFDIKPLVEEFPTDGARKLFDAFLLAGKRASANFPKRLSLDNFFVINADHFRQIFKFLKIEYAFFRVRVDVNDFI